MGIENLKFNPGDNGADFSIFLQGDLMREEGLDRQTQLEWVIKNSAKFREIIEKNPELKERYFSDPESVKNFVKKALEEAPEEPVN